MSQILPTTMRFIDVPEPGGPEAMKIATGPLPAPAPGEVLIRVQAAGVNRPDVQQRKGAYPPPPGASPILGLEAAGDVVARGEGVTEWKLGAQVTALCNGGAYAEYVVAPATQCLPWPRGFTAVQAAALPENYFTVWANVFDMAALAAGEKLLVHGGTSGIGITAIQFALACGAEAFATAGSAEKCAAITRLGATAINYKEADFVAAVREATAEKGVDVVLDMVGGLYTARNLNCLARDGRLMQIAFMQGSVVKDFDLLPVMMKRLRISGSTLRPRTAAEKGAITASLRREIWPKLEAGVFAPIIDSVLPLAQVAEAHRRMESSAHIGKIMLTMAE